MRSVAISLAVICLVNALGVFLSRVAGQEFRIETDVFVDEQKEPIVETLTIFSDGVVYDFLLTGVEEITLFDRRSQSAGADGHAAPSEDASCRWTAFWHSSPK